jgi:mRNA interferase MazF
VEEGLAEDMSQWTGTIIATVITGQPQKTGSPLALGLKSAKLPKKSWIKISRLRTVSVDGIGKVIGKASLEELTQVIEGLNEIIA